MSSLNLQIEAIQEENYDKKKKFIENELIKLEETIKNSKNRIKDLDEMENRYCTEVEKLEFEFKEFESSGGSVILINFRLIILKKREKILRR